MKVLCPVDFSETSVNAVRWISTYLNNQKKGSLYLSHFIYVKRRASMFLSIDDIFKDKAEEDMQTLINDLEREFEYITYHYDIYLSNPKDGIVYKTEKEDFDLIVTGSTGLTALKDITIGSVSEYIMQHCTIPLLIVPDKAIFENLQNIGIGLDDELFANIESLSMVREMSISNSAQIRAVHVIEKPVASFEYDPAVDWYFRDLDFTYEQVSLQGSVSDTLGKYCQDNKLDILCMLHHKRNWLGRLFLQSMSRSKLFDLDVPLLILNEN